MSLKLLAAAAATEMSGITSSTSAKRKTTIPWTEELEMVLCSSIMSRKAHRTGDGLTLEAKWALVVVDVSKHAYFNVLPKESVTIECLKLKWRRMRKTVSDAFSLEDEGANLSGLEAEIGNRDKIVYDLIVDELKSKGAKKEDAEKKAVRNSQMLEFENKINGLGSITIALTPSKESDVSSHTSTSESTEKSIEDVIFESRKRKLDLLEKKMEIDRIKADSEQKNVEAMNSMIQGVLGAVAQMSQTMALLANQLKKDNKQD